MSIRRILIAAFVVVQLAAVAVTACCECKCRKVNPDIASRSWTGCDGSTPVPFTGTPPYFVERIECDGPCPSGRRLGFFPSAYVPWSDAWVDEAALGEAFPCSFKDNRCTTFSPSHCSLADVANATAKSRFGMQQRGVKMLPQVRSAATASGRCPDGQAAKTCRWTNRPCTLRCLLDESSVCDDAHHFCNYLSHGQIFCVSTSCPNGFFGGSAPGVQDHATILIGDTEDA